MRNSRIKEIRLVKGDEEVICNSPKEVAEGLNCAVNSVYYAMRTNTKIFEWAVIPKFKEYKFNKEAIEEKINK